MQSLGKGIKEGQRRSLWPMCLLEPSFLVQLENICELFQTTRYLEPIFFQDRL